MTIMGSKTRIIFIIGLLAQLQGSSQIDKDEDRPYEFSFTIDGEQHRYEKKDVQGIIQGEFGFITGDGIYHVTVYATDENGSFKILSMKNVRISGPLDGSNVDIKNVQDTSILKYTDKPISRPEIKYTTSKPLSIYETKYTTSKPLGIYETKYTSSKPLGIYETKYTTSKPLSIYETKYTTSKPLGIYETKYTNKPLGIYETKYASKSPYTSETSTFKPQIFNSPSVYTTTPRTSIFKITTVSTIRPGCGGCGIIARTTPKVKPLQNPISFSNSKPPVESAYPQPLSLPVTPPKPNYSNNHIYNNNDKPSVPNTAYFKPETYETTTKPSLHYNYNFENHAKPESVKPPVLSSNNYENNNYKQETYGIAVKPLLLGNNNFGNNFKPQTFESTAKPSQFSSNNYYDKSSTATSYNPTSKPEPFTSNNNFGNNFKPQTFVTTVKPSQFSSNNYYDQSSTATSYNPTSKPEPSSSNNNFGNNFKPQTVATTAKPSQFNSNNYYDKSSKVTSYNPTLTPAQFTSKIFETSTKRVPSNYNAVQFSPITPSKSNLQENKNVIYPSPQKQIHSISSEIKTENGNIYVPGIAPIPIKDKYPNMTPGLPNGITQSDIVGLLYKFNYTVGFHGHYEKGWNNGTKIGGYFVNGRDGYSRIVTYIADENGYRPKFRLVHLGYDSADTPKADSEKKFGLKNFEFVWYPVN